MPGKSNDLTFRLFGEDVNMSLALRNIAAEADKSAKQIKNAFGSMPSVITAGFAIAGVASVKMAADFEDATGKLITGAGESEKNISLIRDGLLKLAPAVGIGPTALAKAMFMVESAGFHAADGLTVMKAAAEGAKVGGADATVVANALTTALTDFALPASDAAKVTSQLVATVATGKTNMAELAGSLSAVAPKASAAGISLSEMLGAMGTMTGEGVSAQQAAQDLASSISALSNPSAVQTKAMAQMGLTSIDVAKNLGKNGLSGTFETLAGSIMKHMGPSGLVLQDSFNQSKLAAASAQEMLGKLPKSLQTLGKEFLDNKITQKEWAHALKGQDVLTANLGHEFALTAKTANGFSESLKSGAGSAATFNGMMADMTGGTNGLSVGLALTGTHMATFKSNVETIGGATVEAGGHVKGWAETSKDFSLQLEKATAGIQAMGIKIGTALMPYLSKALQTGKEWTDALSKNKPMLDVVLVAVGLLAGGFVFLFAALKITEAQAGLARIALFWLGTANKEGAISAIAQTVATAAGSVAHGVATAAAWAFNVALSANPIALIVIGIAALVAGLVWFVTQTKLGKDVFKNVMSFMSDAVGWVVQAFKVAVSWVAQNWPLLITILLGPIGALIAYVITHFGEIVGFFTTVFQAVSVAFTAVGTAFTWVFQSIIWPTLKAIGAVFTWVWNSIIWPILAVMILGWTLVGIGIAWLYNNAVLPAVKGIAAGFVWLAETIMRPVMAGIALAIRAVGAVFTWLYENIIRPVFNGISTAVKAVGDAIFWLVSTVISVELGIVQAIVKAVGDVFTWLWKTVAMPAFDGIGRAVKTVGGFFVWLWAGSVSPAVDWISGAINTLGGVIGSVFGGIGKVISGAFSGTVGFIRGIINQVIDLVNGGIGNINGVGAFVKQQTHGLVDIQLGYLPHLATGGTYGRGGLALVGENGPEIVKLPGGATVYPTGTQMGGGGGGTTVNITVQGQYAGDQNALAKLVLTAVTNAARQGAIPRNAFRTV